MFVPVTDIYVASELSKLTRTAVEFQSSIYSENPFRGPPGPAVDREWDRFSAHREFTRTLLLTSMYADDHPRSY